MAFELRPREKVYMLGNMLGNIMCQERATAG